MSVDYNGHHEDEFLHDTRTWKVQSSSEGITPFNEVRLYRGVLSSLALSNSPRHPRQKTARSICISICHDLDNLFKDTSDSVIKKSTLKDIIAKNFFINDEYNAGKYFILSKFAH